MKFWKIRCILEPLIISIPLRGCLGVIANGPQQARKVVSSGTVQPTHERDAKVILYNVISTPCTTRFGTLLMNGFCDPIASCIVKKGKVVGFCPGNAVCCLVTPKCGQMVSSQSSYFVSPNYNEMESQGLCEVKVRPSAERTCQIRLNFIDFAISGPDSSGSCLTEYFEVAGSDANYPVPKICGINSGQHMYLSFSPFGGEISLLVKSTNSKWIIAIQQIPCTPVEALAPAGCLQNFITATGQASSFNIDGGQHLANQNYEICIRRETANCVFNWSKLRSTDIFAISTGTTGETCFTDGDYLNILDGTRTSTTRITSNIYCGTATTSETFSISTPFERLQVVFNNPLTQDTDAGFRLAFNRTCT